MSRETVLTNAAVVMRDEVVTGSVHLQDGFIKSIDDRPARSAAAVDLEGSYLLPGLIELHTDNLEKHFVPRPGVRWPALPAIMAHDAAVASAGITTVLNAVATGDIVAHSSRAERFAQMVEAVRMAASSEVTRAEHLLHIRCELTSEATLDRFEEVAGDPLLRLVSVMDHSPGQRQFVDVSKYREYFQGKYHLNDEQIDELIERQTEMSERISQQQRRKIAEQCHERGLALASHDDATIEHVQDAVTDGIRIAEFPTTVEAARASRESGLHVLMGAPNVVRGFSHSGNVSARDLAREGLLDTLSSDYVPNSLLHGAFVLNQAFDTIDLPQAVAMITRNPADAAGLHDRGLIEPGKRADLVQVSLIDDVPMVRQVWREGQRVV